MQQDAAYKPERRVDPREQRAFSFWFRPFRSRNRTSAWMLDVSAGGAAFLVATKDAPSVGRRIELIEMQTRHRIVREEANPLPMYARVLRHDSLGDETLRVAVRFEADIESPLKVSEQRVDAVVCPHTPLIQPVPPAAAAGSNAGEDMAWSGPRRRHARISSRRQPAKPTDD